MGLYFTKCIKCGRMWWFCSVDFSTGGEPCDCGKQYHKWCDLFGNIINMPNYVGVPFFNPKWLRKVKDGVVFHSKPKNTNTVRYKSIKLVRKLCTAHYR